MKICIITKHEINWGSSRNRIGLYLPLLQKKTHRCYIIHIIPNKISNYWIGKRNIFSLHQRFLSFWYSRILKNLKILEVIFKADRFDVIIIQKITISPFLLSVLKLRNANLVFDLDDLCTWPPELIKRKIGIRQRLGLWRKDLQHPQALSKFARIIAGNNYLKDLIAPFVSKDKVAVVAASLDCSLYFPSKEPKDGTSIVIGWSGTGENHLKHLKLLVRPLEILAKTHTIVFRLIGAMHSKNIKQLFRNLGSRFICIDWVIPDDLPNEIRKFDIGVMPLEDDEETRGKCGFKALEYMACSLPAVVSPVGVNTDIVQDGGNGFWARNESEWIEKLSILIQSRSYIQKNKRNSRLYGRYR